jgi:hypothetical protein
MDFVAMDFVAMDFVAMDFVAIDLAATDLADGPGAATGRAAGAAVPRALLADVLDRADGAIFPVLLFCSRLAIASLR